MDKDTLFKQVQQLLLFKDYPKNVKISSHLRDNLHMDKFDMAVLRKEIEKKYNISITKTESQKWKTVEDIITAILNKSA